VYASDAGALCSGNNDPVNTFLPERLFVGAARWQFTREKGIERDASALFVRDVVVAQANVSHDALSGIVQFAPLPPPACRRVPKDASALPAWVLQEKSARCSIP